MKLSKFFMEVKIQDNIYAVYNSLLMDVFFVNKDELDDIKQMNVQKNQLNKLKKAGIYVNDYKTDELALKLLKDRYYSVTGKIQIMYLIMTSTCNLACKYCFVENCKFNNKKEYMMSVSTIRNSIKKYTEYLKKNNISQGSVILYGGEPIINWEGIKEAINYSKKLSSPIKFSVVTNATLLNKEKIKFLAENDVEIGISIDGPKKLNDKNRIYRFSNKSVYDEVIEKFPLLKINKCKFGLSITISEEFLDKQDEVLNWLKKLGVNSIFYNLYHYTSHYENWKEYYQRASKFLLKSYDILSKNDIYDGRLIRKMDSVLNTEFKFSDCGAVGANQLTIKPNGDVCVCHGYLKTDKYVIGNILNNTIDELSSSREMDFWRKRNTLSNKKCLKCEALFICGGGCAIQAESLFGDRSCIDKPFCIHSKTALKWVLNRCYEASKKSIEKEVIK